MLRYKLEESISSCWNVIEDIKVLSEYIVESQNFNKDVASNIAIGLEHLYDQRFQKLDSIFREVWNEDFSAKERLDQITRQYDSIIDKLETENDNLHKQIEALEESLEKFEKQKKK